MVTTVARGCARHFALKGGDEAEGFLHEGKDVCWFEVAAHEQIVSREASHGPPVNDAVLPLGMVAQISGGQMLDGMEGSRMDGRLTAGSIHADVEGGDLLMTHAVASAHVNAWQQFVVVDGETGYFFHNLCNKYKEAVKEWIVEE